MGELAKPEPPGAETTELPGPFAQFGGPTPGTASGCPLHPQRASLSLSLLWPAAAQRWQLPLVHSSSQCPQVLALEAWVELVVLVASGSPQVGNTPRSQQSQAWGKAVPGVGRSGGSGLCAARRCRGTGRGAARPWRGRETP